MIRICSNWLRTHCSYFSKMPMPTHQDPEIDRIQKILNKSVAYKQIDHPTRGSYKVVQLSQEDHEKVCEANFNEEIKKIVEARASRKNE